MQFQVQPHARNMHDAGPVLVSQPTRAEGVPHGAAQRCLVYPQDDVPATLRLAGAKPERTQGSRRGHTFVQALESPRRHRPRSGVSREHQRARANGWGRCSAASSSLDAQPASFRRARVASNAGGGRADAPPVFPKAEYEALPGMNSLTFPFHAGARRVLRAAGEDGPCRTASALRVSETLAACSPALPHRLREHAPCSGGRHIY